VVLAGCLRRGLIWAVIGFGLVTLIWPRNGHTSTNSSNDEHDHCDGRDNKVCTNERIDQKETTHEHTHRVHEKLFWVLYIALTVFTIIIASYAAYLAYGSLTDGHEALIAVQRAFVFPTTENREFLPVPASNGWLIVTNWENSGATQSVGLVVQTHVVTTYFETDDPIEHDVDRVAEPVLAKRLIGPHQTVMGVGVVVSAESLLAIGTKEIYASIVSKATYRDIFGISHVTQKCEKIIAINGDPNNFGRMLGFTSASCDKHNCADEECVAEEK
jgi:hypothetical protein